MLTAAGSGYSRWRDMAVTRWREDATCDDWGSYIFLRDVSSGDVWSAGLSADAASSRTVMKSSSTRIARRSSRRDGTLDHDARNACLGRGRRRGPAGLHLESRAAEPREIELTSYAELVLAPQARRRRASRLLQNVRANRVLAEIGAILATRRRRTPAEPQSGPRISRSPRARPSAIRNSRPIARASSGADAAARADRGDGRPAAVRHDRHRARSDLRLAPPRHDRAGRHRTRRLLDHRRRRRARRCSTCRQASRLPPPSSARRRSPGRRRRCSFIIWASTPTRPRLFSASPATCIYADPALRPSSDVSAQGGGPAVRPLGSGHLGRPADRAGAHRRYRGHRCRRASCCRRTNTGG